MKQGGYREGAGRKKGYSALETEKARELICQKLSENLSPILDTLINQAKIGNIRAIGELFDRAYGRPPQATELIGNESRPIEISLSEAVASKYELVSLK